MESTLQIIGGIISLFIIIGMLKDNPILRAIELAAIPILTIVFWFTEKDLPIVTVFIMTTVSIFVIRHPLKFLSIFGGSKGSSSLTNNEQEKELEEMRQQRIQTIADINSGKEPDGTKGVWLPK